jgi:hypothetical protein
VPPIVLTPRGKIYGLLGLATDSPGIVPDYNKSVRDVYIDVARSQFNAAQNLDLITQSLWPLGNTPTSNSSSPKPPAACGTIDLPSWLPNFSATEARKILFAQRSIFAAGAPTCPQPVVITTAGVLTISGTVLATLMTLKPVRDKTYTGKGSFSWLRDWLPDSLATSNSTGAPQSYPTGGDAFEAYWRTLMTDCNAYPSRRLSKRDIKEYGHLFNEWRAKAAELPLNSVNGLPHKYGDDEALLYAMGNAIDETDRMSSLIWTWRFAELEDGLYAMVPWEGPLEPEKGARAGDVVAVVEGGKVPLILRERVGPDGGKESAEGSAKWEVVGTGYVHGFMDGLAAKWVERGILKKRTFDIV